MSRPQENPTATRRRATVAGCSLLALVLLAAGCGGDDGAGGDGQPRIAVTTSLLGDVVEAMVGDQAEVEVLMSRGADPHELQLSARQANDIREADALITNGAGFEEGMLDSLDAAESDGVPTHAAIDRVETMAPAGGAGHAEDDHDDDGGVDPHFFTDPDRMAGAAQGIADFLAAEVPALDDAAFRTTAAVEVDSLRELATDLEDTLSVIPAERRKLVTNHEVFGYLADRYGFEVVGAVIPGVSTTGEANARDLDELATTIEAEDVPAVFADTSSPESLSDALADEVGPVEVVPLYTESLGPAGSDGATYDAMMRTDAQRMVDALS